ncbi:restin homolog isoform X15 [Sitodiplosis mosellana]|uniref:restin homolog isoform X15 n=1 Tax=Sitodiplosis mosellana TaxID=263140 RepID=UPI00244529E2|nr:restin homolog isoform X15 [Sitodiplosis mosellana]XP_055300495.1 restin homolog isoform X15 [Sitodiplosis mosellana]XP_055300496.1 restin homolog isoform X15 [Sitodiplosis mosellana]
MSEINPESQTDGAAQELQKPVRAPSPTPSEKSIKSDVSTASSRLLKPTGMRPPSSTATIRKPSTSSITVTSTPVSSRIGRLCTAHGHGAKAGPPPLELHKNESETSADKMRRQSDEYSRSHLADQGVVLTTDTDQFIIGQRVFVGGHRPGQIAFIGETHFAPGDWAGIVLDDTSGKNDGCVSGKRYFQCEPKRGIFSRLTRLTLEPLGDITCSSPTYSMNTSVRSISSPPRSGTVSPTRSVSSYVGKSPSKTNLSVGDRVIVSSGMGSRAGILQYIGETKFAPGNWCGVQLDEPSGKNDGTVDGVQYFNCPPNFGIFVPLAKVSLSPLSRKSRLSRAGSKESLNSIGTMGSITSTNTSRLRMSAQRLSSAAKPPASTSKNTFSLQDLLREKQNHIEQLILERDLTRQQTENDTMVFQKEIRQLRERVATLERQLEEERLKSEDLQFRIDEATICGGNETAQLDEYREKIAGLEKQLLEANANKPNEEEINALKLKIEELTKLQTDYKQKLQEITELQTRCDSLSKECEQLKEDKDEFEKSCEIKISSLGVSETCLREEIDFLKRQNEDLKSELVGKDAASEKQYLDMKQIENDLRDELISAQNQLKQALVSGEKDIEKLVNAKDAEIIAQKEEIESLERQYAEALKEKEQAVSVKRTEQAALSSANDKYAEILGEWEVSKKSVEAHMATIQDLQKTLEEKTQNIEQLSKDIQTTQAAVEFNKQEIATKEGIISTLQAMNNEKETKHDELQGKLDKTNAELSQVREVVVVEKDKHIAKLAQDISELTQRIDEIMGVKSKFETEAASKTKELVEAQKKYAQLQKTLETERNQSNNEKSKEIDNLRTTLNTVEDSNKELTEQITKQKNVIESHENTLKSLQEKLAETQVQNDNNESTVDNLNLELKKQNNQLADLAKANSDLKSKAAELQNSLDTSLEENDKKERQLKNLKQKCEQLQIQVEQGTTDAEKGKASIDELNTKIQSLSNELTGKAEKLLKLEVDYADSERKQIVSEEKLEQLLSEKTSLQQNLEALQSSSSDSNTEIRRLVEDLKAKQEAYDLLVDSSNETKLNLEKSLHETQQNLAARTSQHDKLKNEMNSLTAQKIDRENELNLELSKIKEAYESEAEALKNEIDALKMSFREEKERLHNERQESVTVSDRQLAEHKSTIDNLENTIKNLQKEISNTNTDLEQRMNELTSASNKVNDLESMLNEKIAHTKQAEEKAKGIEKALNEKLTAKDNEIQLITAQIQSLEERLSAAESEAEKVSDDKNTVETSLRKQIIALEEANKVISEEKKQTVDKLSELESKYNTLGESFRDTEDEQVDLVNKNLEYQRQVDELLQTVSAMDELKQKIQQQETDMSGATAQIQSLQKELEEKTATFTNERAATAEQVKLIESQLRNTNENFQKYKNDAEQAKTEIENLIKSTVNESNEKDKIIKALEEKVSQLAPSVNLSDDLKNELKDKSEELKLKESNIVELIKTVDDLKKQCAEKDANLASALKENEAKNKRSSDEIQQKTRELGEAHKKIAAAATVDSENKQLKDKITELTNNLDRIQIENQQKVREMSENSSTQTNELANLRAELVQIEEMKKKEIEELTLKLWDSEAKVQEQSDNIDKLNESQSNDEEATRALKTREAELLLANKKLEGEIITLKSTVKEKERLLAVVEATTLPKQAESFVAEGEPGAQISFLNSIIADMQRKNEALKEQIRSAELFKNPIFDMPAVKRLPAPRLFCDICDEFDKHDTEDCPVQSSESSPMHTIAGNSKPINNGQVNADGTKKRVLPPPRKYCEVCEEFDHEAGECNAEETY